MAGTLCALSTISKLERIDSKDIALNTNKIITHLIQDMSTGHLSCNPLFTVPLVDTKFFAVVIEFDDYVQLEERIITHWTS